MEVEYNMSLLAMFHFSHVFLQVEHFPLLLSIGSWQLHFPSPCLPGFLFALN